MRARPFVTRCRSPRGGAAREHVLAEQLLALRRAEALLATADLDDPEAFRDHLAATVAGRHHGLPDGRALRRARRPSAAGLAAERPLAARVAERDRGRVEAERDVSGSAGRSAWTGCDRVEELDRLDRERLGALHDERIAPAHELAADARDVAQLAGARERACRTSTCAVVRISSWPPSPQVVATRRLPARPSSVRPAVAGTPRDLRVGDHRRRGVEVVRPPAAGRARPRCRDRRARRRGTSASTRRSRPDRRRPTSARRRPRRTG